MESNKISHAQSGGTVKNKEINHVDQSCRTAKNKEINQVLMAASVASMIDQFNMQNIQLLLRLGYEVHAACNFKEGNTCDKQRIWKFKRTLKRMGVHCHQWDCPRNLWAVEQGFRAYRQMLHLLECHSFAWIHCHSPIGGALARIAAHQKKTRVIYTAHGFHFYRGAPILNWMLFYPVERLLAHWTDVLITVNQEDYRLAKRKLKAGKIFYTPGAGIDTGRFWNGGVQDQQERTVFRRKYHISENAAVLLSVGELSRNKNHQAVISALAGMPEKEIHYFICGQGKLKKYLLRKAEQNGMARRVHILGFQENVSKFYRNADLFVLPSKREGLSAALIEAMASGLPCVVSDIRGNRELIGSRGWTYADSFGDMPVCRNGAYCKKSRGARGGILFPPMQPDRLAAALKVFLEHPRLRSEAGCYNRKRVRKYDVGRVSRRMEQVYKYMEKDAGKGEPEDGADV